MIKKNKIPDVMRATENAIQKSLKSAAILVEGEAITRTPVDTGNLRGSMTHDVGKNEARVGTNVEYAPYVEFGTSDMAAQPYLRPALDENTRKITSLISDVIGREIKGAVR